MQHTRRIQRIKLTPLGAEQLGLDGSGIVLHDDKGKELVIPGHVHRVQGRVHLAQFALTHFEKDTGHIALLSNLSPQLMPALLSPVMMNWAHDYASPQIQVITRALIDSGAWERGIKPVAQRVPRWIIKNIKHRLGLGSGS
jgi:hypothetical protein